MDGARDPGGGFGDEAVEEGAGGRADVVAALGMPLDAENEVGGGAFAGLAAFDGFDDGVLRAAGGDAEAVAGDADGLMVAGVDGQAEEVVLFGSLFCGEESAKEGFGCGGGGVGDGDLAAGGVIDGKDGEVLHQRAAAPDVEDLDAEADGEDRLVEIVRVLKEKLIDVFARGVGGGALGDGVLTVFVRVDVGGTAGEKNGLAGVDQVGDRDGCGVERNLDGLAAAALDSNRRIAARSAGCRRCRCWWVAGWRCADGDEAWSSSSLSIVLRRSAQPALEDGVGDVGIGLVAVGRLAESELCAGALEGEGGGLVREVEGVGGRVPGAFECGEGNADALRVVGGEDQGGVGHQLLLSGDVGIGAGCRGWKGLPFAEERIGCGRRGADARQRSAPECRVTGDGECRPSTWKVTLIGGPLTVTGAR